MKIQNGRYCAWGIGARNVKIDRENSDFYPKWILESWDDEKYRRRVLRVQFIRAWCRGISIYFTYGLWRSAAAAVLTRLCRPPARSYADNFRPTGNELNWKPRKRQGSGFVIYQTHALPNRFSLSLKMIYPLNYYYYYYSNRVIEGSSHARFITLLELCSRWSDLFNLCLIL